MIFYDCETRKYKYNDVMSLLINQTNLPIEISPHYIQSIFQAPVEELCFFDIETTGLTAFQSYVYLIGAIYYDGTSFVLRQWLTSSFLDEQALLSSFISFCSSFSTIIHLGGNRFDLPFLNHCFEQYHLTNPFFAMNSIDISTYLKKFKSLFSLPNTKQITYEALMHFQRTEISSSTDLLLLYKQYEKHASTSLSNRLFLHNQEDLHGLVSLCNLLCLPLFQANLIRTTTLTNESSTIILQCELSYPAALSTLCWGFEILDTKFDLSISNTHLSIRIPCETVSKKTFFENYRDYYFLPDEGYAVYKTIAEFMDHSRRQKASKLTAYQQKEGAFLPLPNTSLLQYISHIENKVLFKDSHNARTSFLLITPSLLEDVSFWNAFVCYVVPLSFL